MEIIFLIICASFLFLLPFLSEFFCHLIIFCLLFNAGVFSLLGISSLSVKVIAYALIIALFLKQIGAVVISNKKVVTVGSLSLILFVAAILFSFLINSVNTISFIYFLMITGMPFLYMLALLNSKLNEQNYSQLFRLLIYLFAVQIPAILIKFIIVGQSEKGAIGTISTDEGSLSTIIPLFAISYLYSSFLSTRKKWMMIWMLLFILFGIIGAKRAIVIYVPIVVLFISIVDILFDIKESKIVIPKIKYLCLSILGVCFLIYLTAVTNPTLNPEGRVGGSFSLQFLKDYTLEYETRTREGNAQYLGRLAAPSLVYSTVKERGLERILFGLGPGTIIESRFVEGSKDVLLERYGIGYGARTGILWLFFQVGIIGCLFYITTILSIVISAYRRYEHVSNINRQLFLSFLGFSFVYFLDFFTYSSSMMYTGALMVSYIFVFCYMSQKNVTLSDAQAISSIARSKVRG